MKRLLDYLGVALDAIVLPASRAPKSKLRRSWKLRLAIYKSLTGLLIEQAMFRLGVIQCVSKLNYSQACMQAQLNATTTTVGNAGQLHDW